ncbi:MAG: hypothetical protein A49_03640 [Methyloceanibacter sp.]|nr:MAG: hypothetical protein A49_03640 [Methyloceanibacter sp.]
MPNPKTKTIEFYIRTSMTGSECRDEIEVDADLSGDELDELIREAAFNFMEWGYVEKSRASITPEVIRTIIERVERGSGPDRDLDWHIHYDFFGGREIDRDKRPPKYTASIDAAVALTEKLLPDREWNIWRDDENEDLGATVANDNWDELTDHFRAKCESAPRSILSAALHALLATMEDE